MKNYLELCYHPILNSTPNSNSSVRHSAPFTVWYKKDFGLCFEYIVFVAFLGALFGTASAFYAGVKHTKISRRRKSATLVLRGLVSLCILATTLVNFVGSFWLSKGRPYSVTLSQAVLMVGWTVHLAYLWVLASSVTHYGRGPANLNVLWILLFTGNILQLRTTIRWQVHPDYYQRSSLPISQAYFSELSDITTYVLFGLQCLYGLTLFLKVGRVTGDNIKMSPPFQSSSLNRENRYSTWSDDADKSVRQHLISAEWNTERVSSLYGSITASYDSGLTRVVDFGNVDATEDGTNPLSLLSFWWVGPLMRRGALGLLQKPEDLLQLPKSLGTSRVRRRFQELRGTSEGEPGSARRGVGQGDGVGEREHFGGSGHGSPTCATTAGGADMRSGRDCQAVSKWSLFHSLNRAFGLHYYPLGVLKLLSDMLGFAGPLLLHALVSFMEEKTVS